MFYIRSNLRPSSPLVSVAKTFGLGSHAIRAWIFAVAFYLLCVSHCVEELFREDLC